MLAPGDESPAFDRDRLAQRLGVLASPIRVALLHRLSSPAFVSDLAPELGLTRQALARHLEELVEVGLVETQRDARRGFMPATRYAASPAGLFALKEELRALALPHRPRVGIPAITRAASGPAERAPTDGAGLLLLHGDIRGRWFPLAGASSIVVGRGGHAEVSLDYDPFVSTRHAHLHQRQGAWSVTDLHSKNGTSVNFDPLAPGEERAVRHGDVLEIGRSLLLLRSPAHG